MWRWICGIPRALRQHLHNPRLSTTACLDEEKNKKDQTRFCHATRQNNFHGKQKDDHEDDREWWKNKPRWNSFTSSDTLGVLGLGAIVYLSLQISRCHQKVRERKEKPVYARNCLLSQISQIAYCLPSTVRRFGDQGGRLQDSGKIPVERVGPGNKEDPLEKVLNEFENVVQKYVAVAKNIQAQRKAKTGEMTEAVSMWEEASDMGYSRSQFNLGLSYETGHGVTKDARKAAKYYKLAAAENHAQAMYNLALMYQEGEGISQNTDKATSLMEKAADLGLAQAQTYLGVHYTEPDCQNFNKAVSLFSEAAKQEHPEAQYFLGICYEQGWGVEVNECKAAHLYSQAAQSGHDGALYNLAVFHEHGIGGLPEDLISAEELYRKSANLGNEMAGEKVLEIDAKRVVKPWKGNYPSCKMDEFLYDIDQFRDSQNDSASVSPGREDRKFILQSEQKTDLKGNTSKISLHSSSSSPSLSEYVRQHFSQLQIGAVPVSDLLPLLSTHESGEVWHPQFGSPKITSPVSPSVLFTLGDEDEELMAVNRLNLAVRQTDIQFQIPEKNHHHFCSMIQRNSTMPDLQSQAVSCV
ncbi:uncharacterized protein LOC125678618 isoform X5 [Ostrea edulis]|uniref:uncharacterized protein LOC125678618 isoform X5 n=1 Tax=Ostrea edulis TaxID=37623 RepID=UPI0024AF8BEC|nr:uncharacterized protein LOC125678618 isoform X5 [Ostrea edulis]